MKQQIKNFLQHKNWGSKTSVPIYIYIYIYIIDGILSKLDTFELQDLKDILEDVWEAGIEEGYEDGYKSATRALNSDD